MIAKTFLMWLSHTLIYRNVSKSINNYTDELETGQGLVEYALILVLVGVAVMGIMLTMGPAISNVYLNILDAVRGTLD